MILKSFENASVLIKKTRYWPGEKEIYYKNENISIPLTCIYHYGNTIFKNLNKDNEDKIFGFASPRFEQDKQIWWFYPKGDSPECNAAVFAIESNRNFLHKEFSISFSIDLDIFITPEMTKDLVSWENIEDFLNKEYSKMIKNIAKSLNKLEKGLKKWQHL